MPEMSIRSFDIKVVSQVSSMLGMTEKITAENEQTK